MGSSSILLMALALMGTVFGGFIDPDVLSLLRASEQPNGYYVLSPSHLLPTTVFKQPLLPVPLVSPVLLNQDKSEGYAGGYNEQDADNTKQKLPKEEFEQPQGDYSPKEPVKPTTYQSEDPKDFDQSERDSFFDEPVRSPKSDFKEPSDLYGPPQRESFSEAPRNSPKPKPAFVAPASKFNRQPLKPTTYQAEPFRDFDQSDRDSISVEAEQSPRSDFKAPSDLYGPPQRESFESPSNSFASKPVFTTSNNKYNRPQLKPTTYQSEPIKDFDQSKPDSFSDQPKKSQKPEFTTTTSKYDRPQRVSFSDEPKTTTSKPKAEFTTSTSKYNRPQPKITTYQSEPSKELNQSQPDSVSDDLKKSSNKPEFKRESAAEKFERRRKEFFARDPTYRSPTFPSEPSSSDDQYDRQPSDSFGQDPLPTSTYQMRDDEYDRQPSDSFGQDRNRSPAAASQFGPSEDYRPLPTRGDARSPSPTSGYLPPKMCRPKPQYGPPKVEYGVPAPEYGVPAPQYGAPAPLPLYQHPWILKSYIEPTYSFGEIPLFGYSDTVGPLLEAATYEGY